MDEIVFITGNDLKYQIIKDRFTSANTGFNIIRMNISTPEIQSTSISEVASYSAKWASTKLNKAVLLTDVGYAISELNGFPGPYIKYINQWLKPEQLIAMLPGSKSEVMINEAAAFCLPNQQPIVYTKIEKATISDKISDDITASPIDRILIRQGDTVPQADLPSASLINIWRKDLSHFEKIFSNIVDTKKPPV